jgi:RimJ/RimL family protein N-acetyltransferase
MGARAVIVAGERVMLTAPARDDFVERWQVFNDPLLASLLGSPTFAHGRAARTMPPVTREQREALYERHVARSILCFDVRLTDADARCVGEGYLSELSWPRASAELSVAIFSPDDRGKRYGSEGAVLLCAYALDGLGVNRLSLRHTVDNAAAAAATERAGPGVGARKVGEERQAEWAFGRHVDVAVWEVLRSDFPPHPATEQLRTPPAGLER